MDLRRAVAVAKQHIEDAFAADAPREIRLEAFLYDDHLMVWSLTIGFDLAEPPNRDRRRKVVRVSESNNAVLSVRDP